MELSSAWIVRSLWRFCKGFAMRSPVSVCSEISSVVVLLWGLWCGGGYGFVVNLPWVQLWMIPIMGHQLNAESNTGESILKPRTMSHERCLFHKIEMAGTRAAIKVDKKQIHLGSQEEAARLYDRAAFMCGREPNFELSEKEKQELRKFKWEEFLAITRHAITSKKHEKACGERRSESPLQNSDWDG